MKNKEGVPDEDIEEMIEGGEDNLNIIVRIIFLLQSTEL